MVKRLFRRIRSWTTVETLRLRISRPFLPWPVEEPGDAGRGGFGGPARGPAPALAPQPRIAPASVEIRFMRLHVEGRFEDMWEMLADDAQRAWGSVHNFTREMPRLDEWLEILEMHVAGETMLEVWTDELHHQTYRNVARLVMRYHVRQQWKEWTFDRQVHLVPEPGGWRTLCYPTRARIATIH
jgi:hypothetical protein